ncbi:MAG: Glutathione S-transferase, omega, partial [uncultured Frankineae bacterium]
DRAVRRGEGRVLRPAAQPLPHPDHRRRQQRLPGRGRPLRALRQSRLPVGAPCGDRAERARSRGRAGAAGRRPAPGRAGLAVHARRGRHRPGHRSRVRDGAVPAQRPRVRGPGHRAVPVGHPHRADREQRLPRDHARPVDAVDRAAPGRRARSLPRARPSGHRRHVPAELRGDQQRRLQGRLRDQPVGLRAGVRRAVRPDAPARRAPRVGALPGRAPAVRGRHPPLHDAGPLRRRLPRPLQVQRAQAHRVRPPVAVRPRPVPDPRLRRHDRRRPHQAPLLRDPRQDQPDARRPEGPGPVRMAGAARTRPPRRPL